MSPNRVPAALAVLVALAVALLSAACASFDATDTLDVVVPPCIPYPGSDVDPCERRDSWPDLNPYVSVSYDLIQPAPTLEESYLRFLDDELYTGAIQLVVRAIPIPNTTRCGTYSSFGTPFNFTEGTVYRTDHTHCYVDLAVNEYIVGSGPRRLTIDISVWIPNYDHERLAREARIFGERFEGWEWIISIGGPRDPNNAAWMMVWHQDVQMSEDGTILVTSGNKAVYLRISLPEFREINLERAEMTLSDYRKQAKSAYETYSMATGGRIGAVKDAKGHPLPYLVKDASETSLRKYIGEIRIVDDMEFKVTSPPPVPDDGRWNPDGLRINDIIATRVAGGSAE